MAFCHPDSLFLFIQVLRYLSLRCLPPLRYKRGTLNFVSGAQNVENVYLKTSAALCLFRNSVPVTSDNRCDCFVLLIKKVKSVIQSKTCSC